jgi:hypothetical protein
VSELRRWGGSSRLRARVAVFLAELELVLGSRDTGRGYQLGRHRGLRRDRSWLGALARLRLLRWRRLCSTLWALLRCLSRVRNSRLGRGLVGRRRRLLIASRGNSPRAVWIDRLANSRTCPAWSDSLLGPYLLLLYHAGVEHLSGRQSKALSRSGHKIGRRCGSHAAFSMHVPIAARNRNLGILRLAASATHLGHHVREGKLPHLLGLTRSAIWLYSRHLALPSRKRLPLGLDRQPRALLLNKERLRARHLGPERLRPRELRSKRLRPCHLWLERLGAGHLRLKRV